MIQLADEVGVSTSVVTVYFRRNEFREVKYLSRMSATTVFRMLAWLGDYDIRDYLLEEK